MSLILEALKKSEAERRLGQAPGLTTPMPEVRRQHRSGAVRAAASVSVLLLVGVWAWWFMDTSSRPPLDSPPPVLPSNAQAAPIEDEAIATTAASPPTTSVAPPREPSAAPPLPTHTSESRTTQESGASLPRDPEFESLERESTPVPAQATPAPPREDALAIPVIAASTAETEPGSTVAAAVPDAAPATEALPRLDQLPAGERDALPPLKVSMHVYAESPLQRFVLIDGRRYAEGEKLADSLQLVEIRREGTVMDLNGRRFLLPRP